MILNSFSTWIVFFIIYSIIGWLIESIWCSIGERKLVNRGFMSGPWCPIYGFGAILTLLITYPINKCPALVFLVSTITTTILEYLVGYLLETLYKKRWWDYSNRRFNIRGRICLRNSILFGLMAMLTIYVIHPTTYNIIHRIDQTNIRIIFTIILAIMVMNFVRTLNEVSSLEKQLAELKQLLHEVEKSHGAEVWFENNNILNSLKQLRIAAHKQPSNTKLSGLIEKLDKNLKSRFSAKRLIDAFPSMKPKSFINEYNILKHEWNKQDNSFKGIIQRVIANIKKRSGIRKAKILYSIKYGSPTRIVWVFLIGCVVGYIVETIFCLLTHGYVESRQGMLYGPFSQVYGFGAVIIDYTLPFFAKKGNFWTFLGGALLGGLYEAGCSLIQETWFSAVSWQYIDVPFSFLGGRTNLLYMCFWGLLAIIYMRLIYPKITNLMNKFPSRPKIFFTWLIVITLSINMLLSSVSVLRWSDRLNGDVADNTVEAWLDRHYPDSFMEEVYPNMSFTKIIAEE